MSHVCWAAFGPPTDGWCSTSPTRTRPSGMRPLGSEPAFRINKPPRGEAASRKLQATMLQPTPATLGGISRLPMPLTSAVIDYRRRVIFLEELLLFFEPPASNWKRALVSFPARHLSHPASPGSVSAQRNRSAATFSCTPPAGPVRKWNGARREAIKVEGSGLRSSRCRRSRSLPDESPVAMQNRSRRVGAPPGRRVVQAGRPIQDW